MSTSTKALIGVLLAGMAGILVFLFVHLSSEPSKPISLGSAKATACSVGQNCLPDVHYVDTHGTVYKREDLAGKVVVINFWATWCGPCEKEIPDLSKVYTKYKDRGLVMLGVLTSDEKGEQALLNFASDHEMTYPIVRATSDIMVSYQYPGNLPTTFVFDRGGKQVLAQAGALSERRLEQMIAPLIAQAKAN
ncbi:MAG: TlpA family protein disulfide reductase [Kofleriaceae bacterium]